MSKRYSNKGYQARKAAEAAAAQPKKNNAALITALITVFLGVAIVLTVAISIGIASGKGAPEIDMAEIKAEINSASASDFTETAEVTNYVKITVKDYGEIVLRLRPDVAPKSVENFQKLVKEGHYSDKIFHRVIQNFMIQGGGFDTTGKQHEVASIKGEFSANGVENNLLHVRGVIYMARTNVMDSASNQFFICDATKPHLDGQYAAFGYVLAGMDVVDAIAAVKTSGGDENKPLTDVVIEKAVFVNPLK